MDNKSKEITNARLAEIERIINDFRERFQEGTSNSEDFITMQEIEKMWGELQTNTQSIYTEMIRELMSTVNERELIRKKKENTQSKE